MGSHVINVYRKRNAHRNIFNSFMFLMLHNTITYNNMFPRKGYSVNSQENLLSQANRNDINMLNRNARKYRLECMVIRFRAPLPTRARIVPARMMIVSYSMEARIGK